MQIPYKGESFFKIGDTWLTINLGCIVQNIKKMKKNGKKNVEKNNIEQRMSKKKEIITIITTSSLE